MVKNVVFKNVYIDLVFHIVSLLRKQVQRLSPTCKCITWKENCFLFLACFLSVYSCFENDLTFFSLFPPLSFIHYFNEYSSCYEQNDLREGLLPCNEMAATPLFHFADALLFSSIVFKSFSFSFFFLLPPLVFHFNTAAGRLALMFFFSCFVVLFSSFSQNGRQ